LARLSLNDVVEKKGCVCWRLCTVIYSIIVVESWWFWDHGKLMTQRSGGRPLQWLLRYSVSVLRAWNEQYKEKMMRRSVSNDCWDMTWKFLVLW
jgi:hypothetical protein